MRHFGCLILAITMVGCAGVGEPDPARLRMPGRVVAIPDGGRVRIEIGGKATFHRLAGVVAYDLRQPGGPAARRALVRLLPIGTTVMVESEGDEGATVFVGDKNVNVELVRSGWVWPDPRGSGSYSSIIQSANREAKAAHRGNYARPPRQLKRTNLDKV